MSSQKKLVQEVGGTLDLNCDYLPPRKAMA